MVREIWRAGRKVAIEDEGEAQSGIDAATSALRPADAIDEESADAAGAKRGGTADAKQPTRAINEDDDGYDPYSDLHDRGEKPPLFEKDPWD